MKNTIFIEEITIKISAFNDVQLSIFKDIESGGVFGIDSSFIEQTFSDEDTVVINNPFNKGKLTLDI